MYLPQISERRNGQYPRRKLFIVFEIGAWQSSGWHIPHSLWMRCLRLGIMSANRNHMALANAAYLLHLDGSEYSRTTGKPSPTGFLIFWRTRKALASLRYEKKKAPRIIPSYQTCIIDGSDTTINFYNDDGRAPIKK